MSTILWILQWILTIFGLYTLFILVRQGTAWVLLRPRSKRVNRPIYSFDCPEEGCSYHYSSYDRAMAELFITQHGKSHEEPPCQYMLKDGGSLGLYWVCTVHGRQPLTLKPIDSDYRGPCLAVK